ncbi:MAG: prolipoprotein diacylglyceryl transferase [Candidatus Komeilibacteria bacterium]
MLNWLHSYIPQPILFQWGWLSVYWYGLLIAIAVIIGFVLTARIASKKEYDQKVWYDMLFYSLIGGFIGARLYHVILELPYYFKNPLEIFQVWHGGLAIHGGIIGGGLVVYYFAKKNKWKVLSVLDILVLAMPLAQALGRWGNYFNQELFGLPVTWGIFIEAINRPLEYVQFSYFHPTFLYESLANILLFILLLFLYKYKSKVVGLTTSIYLLSYSLIRFILEFIRIDRTPELWGLRWPQWASLIIILLVLIYWAKPKDLQKSNKPV